MYDSIALNVLVGMEDFSLDIKKAAEENVDGFQYTPIFAQKRKREHHAVDDIEVYMLRTRKRNVRCCVTCKYGCGHIVDIPMHLFRYRYRKENRVVTEDHMWTYFGGSRSRVMIKPLATMWKHLKEQSKLFMIDHTKHLIANCDIFYDFPEIRKEVFANAAEVEVDHDPCCRTCREELNHYVYDLVCNRCGASIDIEWIPYVGIEFRTKVAWDLWAGIVANTSYLEWLPEEVLESIMNFK